jgi:hypothetical protein
MYESTLSWITGAADKLKLVCQSGSANAVNPAAGCYTRGQAALDAKEVRP